MGKTYTLNDNDIAVIRQYLMRTGTPLLQLCYDTKISYATLDKIINKHESARLSTLCRLKNYFEGKGVEIKINE